MAAKVTSYEAATGGGAADRVVRAYPWGDQLAGVQRGAIHGSDDAIGSKVFAQAWGLDATGNWSTFDEDPDGDGDWDLQQTRTASTRQTAGSTAEPETLQPKYQHVWSPRYIDAPILRDENTDADALCADARLYYLADANFNVTALVDTTGAVVERYLYAPYGQLTVLDATFTEDADDFSDVSNVTLYTGRELDVATGLYYYRARYYHTGAGGFNGRDPVQSRINLYYLCSNPVLCVDPTGLACIVKRWRREVGKQSLLTADSHFEEGQDIYSAIGYYQVQGYNADLKARNWSIEIPQANGFQMGSVHVQGDGKTDRTKAVVTGHLFFLTADVCEDEPGDCLVDFTETQIWTRVWKDREGWSWYDPQGKVTSYTGRTPTIGNAVGGQPYIGVLKKQHAIHGNANKRIVCGDLTVRINPINHSEMGTQLFRWGANQRMRIYDKEGHSSQMNHRFSVWTATTFPYSPTFKSVGSSDRIQ